MAPASESARELTISTAGSFSELMDGSTKNTNEGRGYRKPRFPLLPLKRRSFQRGAFVTLDDQAQEQHGN